MRNLLGVFNAAVRKATTNECHGKPPTKNTDYCEDCGGEMVDGECEDCEEPTDNMPTQVSGTGMEGSPLKVGITPPTPQTPQQPTTTSNTKVSSKQQTTARAGSPVSNSGRTKGPATEVNPMTLTEKQRKEAVGFLTVNCDCWKGAEKTLNSFTDEQLVKLIKTAQKSVLNERVLDRLRKVSGAPKNLTTNEMPAFIKDKIEGEEEEVIENDDAVDGSNAGATGGGTVKADPEEGTTPPELDAGTEVGDSEIEDVESVQDDKAITNADVRFLALNLKQQAAAEKSKLIKLLVSNVRDPKVKARLVANHRRKTLSQLRDEAAALPSYLQPLANSRRMGVQRRETVYGPRFDFDDVTENAREDDQDILELPSMGWSKKA